METKGKMPDGMEGPERAEIKAHNRLIDDGGRPSHPIKLPLSAVRNSREYRDILSYWQNTPGKCQVFTKQLRWWQRFREFQQKQRRPNQDFDLYAERVISCLAKDGVEPPQPWPPISYQLRRDISQQTDVVTWLECLSFAHDEISLHKERLESGRQGFDEAWDRLLSTGLLKPSETVKDNARATRERYISRNLQCEAKRVRLVGFLYSKPDDFHVAHQPQGTGWAEAMQTWNKLTAAAEQDLKRMTRREECLTRFFDAARDHLALRDSVDNEEKLVRWVREQVVALIDAACVSAKTFDRFMRLPAELRIMVWQQCVPAPRSAHFFDVVSATTLRRLVADRVFPDGIRVRATAAHASAYRVVYNLLASCWDARHVTAAEAEAATFRTFRSFDWIPDPDLIVLCLPLKKEQAAWIPAANAVSLDRGPARHVGIFVPDSLLYRRQSALLGAAQQGGEAYPSLEDTRRHMRHASMILECLREDAGGGSSETGGGGGETSGGDAGGGGGETSGGGGGGGIKSVDVILEGITGGIEDNTDLTRVPSGSALRMLQTSCRLAWRHESDGENETATRQRFFWGGIAVYLDPHSNQRQVWWLGKSGLEALAQPATEDAPHTLPSLYPIIQVGWWLHHECLRRHWPELKRCGLLGVVDFAAV
ncbi:hypothetical protein B0T26DRAFT_676951 [Lasiosphaeria miniovina]|uniref:2EXR domain-containing protein n=1 Tax=Lasiosphaeria miniovina TaxID=1954250 RepID=A0AA40AAU1_9PEZI|nr:uncharacterized protein B0T26DRAFT_676951 [Lasiosphaeria miniovina]KAK0712500.1 hypothetical protein B0T26DRAFT_676951 [Lasiosphaeria miniovina]